MISKPGLDHAHCTTITAAPAPEWAYGPST
jgi:hypothetical protein